MSIIRLSMATINGFKKPEPPLGALSQSWIAAEASLPLSWRLTGLMQFGGE